MIRRLRLLVVLARPAVVALVALFTTIGLAQAGAPTSGSRFVHAFVVVVALLLFAVAVNDIADERIDRVNLAASERPLVARSSTRFEMIVVAATAAVVALAASTTLHGPAFLIAAGGLAALRRLLVASGTGGRPRCARADAVAGRVRCDSVSARHLRGARASARGDIALLAGLYAGFVGRIVLKDFRDVRGDALFGKRTFLVRHGRRATCAFSAAFLAAGVSVLPFVRAVTPTLVVSYLGFLAATMLLLRQLARSTNARRDAALITGIAILGRGMLVTLYAHFAMAAANWGIACHVEHRRRPHPHLHGAGVRDGAVRRAPHQDNRAARLAAGHPGRDRLGFRTRSKNRSDLGRAHAHGIRSVPRRLRAQGHGGGQSERRARPHHERNHALRDRGPAQLEVRVVHRAPLPQGVLAHLCERDLDGVGARPHRTSACRVGDHQRDAAGESPGAGCRARRDDGPRFERSLRVRHGSRFVDNRDGWLRNHGSRRDQGHVRRSDPRDREDVARRAVQLQRQVLFDARAQRVAEAVCETAPTVVGRGRQPRHVRTRRAWVSA